LISFINLKVNQFGILPLQNVIPIYLSTD